LPRRGRAGDGGLAIHRRRCWRRVNLLDGVEPLIDSWEYNVTSPATVIGDVVIVGSSITDTIRRVAPPGHVRAYDARSGRPL
jgi:hypothetical protein